MRRVHDRQAGFEGAGMTDPRPLSDAEATEMRQWNRDFRSGAFNPYPPPSAEFYGLVEAIDRLLLDRQARIDENEAALREENRTLRVTLARLDVQADDYRVVLREDAELVRLREENERLRRVAEAARHVVFVAPGTGHLVASLDQLRDALAAWGTQ